MISLLDKHAKSDHFEEHVTCSVLLKNSSNQVQDPV
jgi:hypothetical protein